MRTIGQLAKEAGISERQFHRRLDAKDPDACQLVRGEVLRFHGNSFRFAIDHLTEWADLLRRCDPEIATRCTDLVRDFEELLKKPNSEYQARKERLYMEQIEAEMHEN